MARQRGMAALFLGAVLLAVSACAGTPASKPAATERGVQTITVRGTDQMRFDPPAISVRANAPVRLTLDGTGTTLVHDFTIDNIGGRRFQVVTQPNGRATGEFTATAPGTYQFYCAQPGHREGGMYGTLTVN